MLQSIIFFLSFVILINSTKLPGEYQRTTSIGHSKANKLNDSPSFNSSNNNGNYVRACYFTNWSQYRQGRGKFLPEHYVPGLCTHMLFAFGWMNEDYTVRAFDPADLPNDWAGEGLFKRVNALKKIDIKLKTLLSIGGWSFGTRLFKEMASTLKNRKTFISSALEFVRKWDFDGLDIDWEYPLGPEDYENYGLLIKELKEAAIEEAETMNKPILLITAAVSASKTTIDQGFDVENISKYFDYIFLMNYDFHGAWSTEIGFNSPLYSRKNMKEEEQNWNIDFAARYWNSKGMPREKIIIGIATYGRGWTMKDVTKSEPGALGSPARPTEFVQEAGVASYYELCEMLSKGAKRYWHSEHKVPYLINDDQWWGYDDKESINLKMDYIENQKFGGAFIWTLDFDDFNGKCPLSQGEVFPLLRVIAERLGGIVIEKVTTTTMVTELPTTTSQMTTTTSVITSTVPSTPHSNICSNKNDGFHNLKHSCEKFLLCLSGTNYEMNCPSGLHFDNKRKICNRPENANCIKKPSVTTTTPKTRTKEFVCPASDGFYGDSENCTRFYRCVRGAKFSFDCPNGLSFNMDSLMCDHYDPIRCATNFS